MVDEQFELTIDDSEQNTLGSGGQGIVYEVNFQGRTWACKWYTAEAILNNPRFKMNLIKNTKMDSPDECFVWPQHFVESRDGGYGYLMDKIPDNYVKFTNIYLGKRRVRNPRTGKKETVEVRFKNIETQLTAAINIINALRTFHRKGMAYFDINDGGFFIDPDTGDARICDCDNASASEGESPLVYGKPGYMAPEIVARGVTPKRETDFHSIAVILFQMFVGGHPYDGEKLRGIMWTDENMKRFYGNDAVFIYHPRDRSNRPIEGVHTNPLRLWPLMPKKMKDKFIRTFVDGMNCPSKRTTDNGWLEALYQFKGLMVKCCQDYSEIADDAAIKKGIYVCPYCGHEYKILTVGTDPIVANKGKPIYSISLGEKKADKIIGMIAEKKTQNGIITGLVNKTDCIWTVSYPGGATTEIKPGEGGPLTRGAIINLIDKEDDRTIIVQGRVN